MGAAFLGDDETLASRFRLGEADAETVVEAHAPTVGRMGFSNVNGQEFRALAVTAVQGVQGPELGPKRSSGEAAEDEDDRLVAEQVVKMDDFFAVDRFQGEVGGLGGEGGAFGPAADFAGDEAFEQGDRRWGVG